MEPDQEKRVNDVLNSIDGVQRAEPNPFLFAKIRNRVMTQSPMVYVPARTVWLVFTLFALLLWLNWRTINYQSAPVNSEAADLKTIISEMQLYPATNQSYTVWSGQNY